MYKWGVVYYFISSVCHFTCLTVIAELSAGVSLGSTDTVLGKKSRLSKNLEEFMQQRDAIPQLIQYLEACKAGALIRFWLDADSFQASTWTRIRTHSLNTVSKSSLIKRRESAKQAKMEEKDITSPNSLSTDGDSTCDKTETLKLTPLDNEEGLTSPVCNTASPIPNHTDAVQANVVNIISDTSEIITNAVSEGNLATTEDHRTREKCKSETSTHRLSLSLDLQNEHTSSGYPLSLNSIDSGAHSLSVKSSSSAISMPELSNDSAAPHQHGQTLPAAKSESMLAEKLKKSMFNKHQKNR